MCFPFYLNKELEMIENKFSGRMIPTTSDTLDGMENFGVCGSGDGTVLIWSHVLQEEAGEDLTNILIDNHPELFTRGDGGDLQYVDAEDTMLYFLR